MRWLAIVSLLLAGCTTEPTSDALCDACATDADCGGNPCFVDATGGHFCGAPCDSCPMYFSCQPVQSTSHGVVQTCFPQNNSCSATPVNHPGSDMSGGVGGGGGDGGSGGGNKDFGPPACNAPTGGTVALSGGTVDRLYFGYTGDTRPAMSTSGYSSSLQATINNIYKSMGALGVEFAMDGGDHMEASNSSQATAAMNAYLTATSMLGKPVFMTLGNHECSLSFSGDCGNGEILTDTKGAAFMAALHSSIGATQPYYRFDVMTQSGKAVFLVVADDAWDSTQQSWLTTQLTDADANAKFTFVSKHHPDGNTDQPTFQTIYNLVTSHKYTLFLTGHSHEYKHQPNDHRAVVMGLGGAPFDNPNQMWYGYLTAMQCSDDHIYVTVYDQATGNTMDAWNVPPQ
jgi:hypothetical protein